METKMTIFSIPLVKYSWDIKSEELLFSLLNQFFYKTKNCSYLEFGMVGKEINTDRSFS